MKFKGVNGALINGVQKCTNLVLKSQTSTYQTLTTAMVVPEVTSSLPTSKINTESWDHISRLDLADPDFNIPSNVDLLLGADILGEIYFPNIRRSQQSSLPTAHNTKFGWIVYGKLPASYKEQSCSNFMISIPSQCGRQNSNNRSFVNNTTKASKCGTQSFRHKCNL